VVAVAILSACFMQEVSGGFLEASPKDTSKSAAEIHAKSGAFQNEFEVSSTEPVNYFQDIREAMAAQAATTMAAQAGVEHNENDAEAHEHDTEKEEEHTDNEADDKDDEDHESDDEEDHESDDEEGDEDDDKDADEKDNDEKKHEEAAQADDHDNDEKEKVANQHLTPEQDAAFDKAHTVVKEHKLADVPQDPMLHGMLLQGAAQDDAFKILKAHADKMAEDTLKTIQKARGAL